MAIDLKNLSPKELQALIANANAQMHEAHAAQVQSVKQKIESLLSASGLTLNDVYPSRAKKGASKKNGASSVAPKYRNPSNPSETWSGRGRQPVWFVKALKRRGVTVDSLLIDGATTSAASVTKSVAPIKRGTTAKKAAVKAPRKALKRVTKRASKKKAAAEAGA